MAALPTRIGQLLLVSQKKLPKKWQKTGAKNKNNPTLWEKVELAEKPEFIKINILAIFAA